MHSRARRSTRSSISVSSANNSRRSITVLVLARVRSIPYRVSIVLVTRTVFLRLLGMAIAGSGIDPAALASRFHLDRADASQFEPLVGERFSVFPEGVGPRVRVRLAKVTGTRVTHGLSRFALVFHGSSREPFGDGIHELHHPALGSLSIFMSPVGLPVEGRRAYQACFSRHVRT